MNGHRNNEGSKKINTARANNIFARNHVPTLLSGEYNRSYYHIV